MGIVDSIAHVLGAVLVVAVALSLWADARFWYSQFKKGKPSYDAENHENR